MENWLQQLIQLLPDGPGYYSILFLIAFGESLPIIGLVVPGSTLIVFAGFITIHGKGLILPLLLITMLGAFLGDLVSFWLGGHFGSKMLTLKSFRKHHRLVKQSEQFFCEHGGKSLFFARFLGPIRGITPFIAGLSNMSGKNMTIYTLISAVLWGIAYPGIGIIGGASWEHAQSLSAKFGLLILLALVVTIIHYWLRRSLKLSGEKNDGH
jgi:undecaprenyl-diphosphatase